MLVEYTIKNKRSIGSVVKENSKTILIMAPNGKKVVKRHKVKHNVQRI